MVHAHTSRFTKALATQMRQVSDPLLAPYAQPGGVTVAQVPLKPCPNERRRSFHNLTTLHLTPHTPFPSPPHQPFPTNPHQTISNQLVPLTASFIK